MTPTPNTVDALALAKRLRERHDSLYGVGAVPSVFTEAADHLEASARALAAMESLGRVQGNAWPADLSSDQRTQPERFAIIWRDDGEPVIDDDDFKFDALIVVHGDFGDVEKKKYVAEVCRRLNATTVTASAVQPLSEALKLPSSYDGAFFESNPDWCRVSVRFRDVNDGEAWFNAITDAWDAGIVTKEST